MVLEYEHHLAPRLLAGLDSPPIGHGAREGMRHDLSIRLGPPSPRGRGSFSLPFSPMPATLGDTEARQRALYAAVAHEYDDVFPRHVAEHYIDKRTSLIKRLLPLGGTVLDVGCGTGQLGAAIASEGYDVFGVDLSAAMVGKARERGLSGTYAAVTTALPFAEDSFDLVLTVATLHHLETPERVATTVNEMGRVVKRGGSVVLWDHNPANPYWPILMRRVPQDSGDERLVPLAELLRDVQQAGLQPRQVFRSGFTPDFLPAWLATPWRLVERAIEVTPGLNVLAAHNVVVAHKP
jgi:SAM-dependent methyltransferase